MTQAKNAGQGKRATQRYLWVDARCSDGALDLAAQGFERELFLRPAGAGYELTFVSRKGAQGCREFAIWSARPDRDAEGQARFAFVAWPEVVLPADRVCDPQEDGLRRGELQISGEMLTLSLQRSGYCRGFDVYFRYRKVPLRSLRAAEVVQKFIALYNSRDAAAVASLFAAQGVLTEPFSQSVGLGVARHEGRLAIERWLAEGFAANTWSAMRLQELRPEGDPGAFVAIWEYMDSGLAEPLVGQTRFVVGDSQIFVAELQVTRWAPQLSTP